jgi:hypothetical protein
VLGPAPRREPIAPPDARVEVPRNTDFAGMGAASCTASS